MFIRCYLYTILYKFLLSLIRIIATRINRLEDFSNSLLLKTVRIIR